MTNAAPTPEDIQLARQQLLATIAQEKAAGIPRFDRTDAVTDMKRTPFLMAMRANGYTAKLNPRGARFWRPAHGARALTVTPLRKVSRKRRCARIAAPEEWAARLLQSEFCSLCTVPALNPRISKLLDMITRSFAFLVYCACHFSRPARASFPRLRRSPSATREAAPSGNPLARHAHL